MPTIDLLDETFIVADASTVALVVHDPARWRAWWPDLDLTVFMDRADAGIRWSVTGALQGSCEIWLEPHGDGVIVHYYLRADPAGGASEGRGAARAAARLRRERTRRWKRDVWALKDELEAGRRPGQSRPESSATTVKD